jgi:betaine-aldehyde dehydrogenase
MSTPTQRATSAVDDFPALIAGSRRMAASGETLDAVDPATGQLIGRFPRCGAAEIDAAVEAAATAATEWGRVEVHERARLLEAIAGVLETHADELALLDSHDNGSTLHMLRDDVDHAIAQLRYFAGIGLHLHGETLPTAPGRLNYTLHRPFGVVGRIIPFNHPLMFAATKIAAPLMAGNAVILKPSEHTSLSALRLGELLADTVPPGLLSIVPGLGAEAGDALVTHPDVRRIAFIGSVQNGRLIQRRAAETGVKTVTLELGGKNPLVVFADADADLAIDGALRGMNFTWQGQSCGSTSRLLVQRERHAEVVERLAERIGALRSGSPQDPATDTGAIVNRAQLEKVEGYIRIGKQEGARLVTGGGSPADPALARGLFIRPTVFNLVDPAGRLAQEEIFGPVLAVIPFDDYDEALRIANSVQYGLTASVFTRDLATAHAFAEDVQAGYVWVNDSSRHILGAAFGGVKDSGVGREEGFEELASYTQPKNVHVRFAAVA